MGVYLGSVSGVDPCLSADDFADVGPCDTVLVGQLRHCHSTGLVARADRLDIIEDQFVAASTFTTGISHVDSLSAEEEVGDIDALRVVACVQDADAVWEWSVCCFPESAAYQHHSLPGDFRLDDGTSVTVSAAWPEDAAVGFRRTESSANAAEDGNDSHLIAAGDGAEPFDEMRILAGPHLEERRLAAFTDSRDLDGLRHARLPER